MLFTLCFDDHTDDHLGPAFPDEVREPMDPEADYAILDELIASVTDEEELLGEDDEVDSDRDDVGSRYFR